MKRITIATLFIMLAALQAHGQEMNDRPSTPWQPQRGTFGVFDWRLTKTVPPFPVPSIPQRMATGTCLVTPDGKYPPNPETAVGTTSGVTVFTSSGAGLVLVVSVISGFLILGGGGQLVGDLNDARRRNAARKRK